MHKLLRVHIDFTHIQHASPQRRQLVSATHRFAALISVQGWTAVHITCMWPRCIHPAELRKRAIGLQQGVCRHAFIPARSSRLAGLSFHLCAGRVFPACCAVHVIDTDTMQRMGIRKFLKTEWTRS